MKYKINIYYSTGDSYNTYDTCNDIGLIFENLDVAKENIKRISEHHDYTNALDGYYYGDKSKDVVIKEAPDKNWFSTSRYDTRGTNSIKLISDNGNDYTIGCFWTGCFNRINSVKIEEDRSDMEIHF